KCCSATFTPSIHSSYLRSVWNQSPAAVSFTGEVTVAPLVGPQMWIPCDDAGKVQPSKCPPAVRLTKSLTVWVGPLVGKNSVTKSGLRSRLKSPVANDPMFWPVDDNGCSSFLNVPFALPRKISRT